MSSYKQAGYCLALGMSNLRSSISFWQWKCYGNRMYMARWSSQASGGKSYKLLMRGSQVQARFFVHIWLREAESDTILSLIKVPAL